MTQHSLTWLRAVAVGALTFMVAVVAFLYVPHWILTSLTTPARGVRVWLATAWIAAALVISGVAAWRSTAGPTRAL